MIKLEDDWRSLTPMREKRAFAAATTDGKGQIIVAGGMNETGCLNTVESYDTGTEQWCQLANMRIARWAFGIYYINGALLSVGGRNDGNASSSFEDYDRNQRSWESHKAEAINTSTLMEERFFLLK